jgi:ATP-binding cassette subfamily C protein
VRRALRFGLASLRRRPLIWLALWSLPEALPTALSGLAVARAVDSGFLAGRPAVGLAWLAALLLASVVSAAGARQVYRRLGELVEPFRDDLVRRVTDGALRRGARGHADDGAVARLTHQVEIVRDTYAGLIVVVRGFLVTVVAAVVGLLSIAPVVVALVLPPFLLGFGAFLATLGMAASRQRTYIEADERLATTAGSVLRGVRDLTARGVEPYAARMVAGPIDTQAAAERGLAGVAALRIGCFVVGGWLPLVLLLTTSPWLMARGLSTGAILGGLTYVLRGLQPALGSMVHGLGGSGLRFVVTVARILDAAGESEPPPRPRSVPAPVGYGLNLSAVTFRYGPHAQPVLHDLDLVVPEGDHLAVVGPSGIGKSTLAGLLCGLLRPDAGRVLIGGTPVSELPVERLTRSRVLIPQEAYIFSGSVWDNLRYLHPAASVAEVDRAVCAVGVDALLDRLGGYRAELSPAALSAGERQLIALVRAYLCVAPVAVLDEATCHLDPAAEGVAERAFADRGGTLIVIAHRISSALRARRILVLDGVAATLGDHATLSGSCRLYQDLLGHWNSAPMAEPPDPIRPGGQIQPAR